MLPLSAITLLHSSSSLLLCCCELLLLLLPLADSLLLERCRGRCLVILLLLLLLLLLCFMCLLLLLRLHHLLQQAQLFSQRLCQLLHNLWLQRCSTGWRCRLLCMRCAAASASAAPSCGLQLLLFVLLQEAVKAAKHIIALLQVPLQLLPLL
jgi:hypothetical protein